MLCRTRRSIVKYAFNFKIKATAISVKMEHQQYVNAGYFND